MVVHKSRYHDFVETEIILIPVIFSVARKLYNAVLVPIPISEKDNCFSCGSNRFVCILSLLFFLPSFITFLVNQFYLFAVLNIKEIDRSGEVSEC